MYDGLLFDLDGLLLDTEAVFYAVDMELLTELGVAEHKAKAALDAMIGQDEATCLAILSERFPRLDIDALNAGRVERIDAAFASGIPIRPRVVELLDRAAADGIPMAVATNSSEKRAYVKLELGGLAGRFGAVIGYDMVPAPKPAPDLFLAAADALGLDAQRCLAFEDSETGARAARAAGCTVVQVPNLLATEGEYADFVADTVMDGAFAARLFAREVAAAR